MKFVEKYSELLKFKPATFRQKCRKLALDGISLGQRILKNNEELLKRPRIQFLYIHHVFKDEEDNLRTLLTYLSRDHEYISYSEAVNKILNGDIDKPYISISSDDGLKNNIRAAGILNEYGAKSCFFICPSIIGEDNFEKIARFSNERLHFPPVEFMTWEDVSLLQKQGHEIGGHTMSHVNMAATGTDNLPYEVGGCYEAIKQKCGKPEHFAYPYGRYGDFTIPARDLVFDSGFKSFSSAERGCHITKSGRHIDNRDLLIRRDHIVLSWPIRHILFFIAGNARNASTNNNFFPAHENSHTDK